jgi:hypothetical protein
LQCGARQNKSLLMIAGFDHHDNDDARQNKKPAIVAGVC